MGLKGARDYQRFQAGERLTLRQAILAHCYACNGSEEGGVDCKAAKSCPLHAYMPYREGGVPKAHKGKAMSPEHKAKLQAARHRDKEKSGASPVADAPAKNRL